MTDLPGPAGPQFRADRPVEQEAVRTTIVGGRPPGSGTPIGPIPRGIEVLVKKAAVDSEFRQRLLRERAAAAAIIGLALDPAEAAMLAAVPEKQLATIIDQTVVPQEHRRAFLGQTAAAMLAALGTVAVAGCNEPSPTKGDRADRPVELDRSRAVSMGDRPDMPERSSDGRPAEVSVTDGIRPDLPDPKPDDPPPPPPPPPPPTKGIRPDRPPVKRD